MENFIYEYKPAILGAIAFYAIFISRNSPLMVVSGLILGFCAFRIYRMRNEYKKLSIIEDLKFRLKK